MLTSRHRPLDPDIVRRRLDDAVGPPHRDDPRPTDPATTDAEPFRDTGTRTPTVDTYELAPAVEDRAGPPGSTAVADWRSRLGQLVGLGGARWDPGRRGVLVLALVAVIALAAAGVVAWRSTASTEPVVTPSMASTDRREGGSAGASTTAVPAGTGTEVVVHVVGRVRRPGLVRLRPGARVADAIDAAGGSLPGTDLGFLNLARKVTDGEEIAVGVTPPPGAGAPAGASAAGGRLDLNTATAEDLDKLPGIGPATAKRIVAYRTEHGGFRAVDELRRVSGIGEARYQELKDLVTV